MPPKKTTQKVKLKVTGTSRKENVRISSRPATLLREPKKASGSLVEDIKKRRAQKARRQGTAFFILGVVTFVGVVAVGLFWYSAQQTSNVIPPEEQVGGGDVPSVLEKPVPQLIPMVRISDTPTTWLNVRTGPGTSFERIARVLPGEEYELLAEENDWYQIEIDEETQGWVTSQYASTFEAGEVE